MFSKEPIGRSEDNIHGDWQKKLKIENCNVISIEQQ